MKKIIVCFLLFILSACYQDTPTRDSVSEILVKTVSVSKTDLSRFHHIPAVFIATNRADLSLQLSGTVDRVLVKVGQAVTQGQALLSVYNPNIDPALDSNFAKFESLKVQIEQVKRDVDNLVQLRKNNSASKNSLEQKQTALKDLQAQQKLVQSQINLALANQSESVIKAPFDGDVVDIYLQKGEFIPAGQKAITLYQPDVLEIEVNLTHTLWRNLTLGDIIEGQYLDQTLTFRVLELAQSADTKSHLLKVIMQLDEKIEHAIGQYVLVKIPQIYTDVYQLPLAAVVDDGINRPYVFIIVENQAQKVQITPLYVENGQIVLTTAVEINQPVIIEGQTKLSAGMKVKVL